MSQMNNLQELTLFAPSNQAWNHPYLQEIKRNPQKFKDILDFHLVEKNLTLDYIMQQNRDSVSRVSEFIH